ncbi:hypothetical protein BaRGS_00036351 [Batillaria attramentaria]|uniref:MAP3K12-binding inhibitory protein 1 n=1 Tax=Batillaria attramentaria TaxID=370345 RepID=A0ABD0JC79_9CAEN
MDGQDIAFSSLCQVFLEFIEKVFGETHKGSLAEVLSEHGSRARHMTTNEIGVHLDSLIANLQDLRKSFSAVDDKDGRNRTADGSQEISSKMHSSGPPSAPARNHGDDYIQVEDSNTGSADFDASVSTSSVNADPGLSSQETVERRIAAFINHKQSEVNEMNVREFCYGLPDSENSCARVDAVFVGRAGSSSHLKVTRVFNTHGPQTRLAAAPHIDTQLQSNRRPTVSLEESVEERLRNVEEHLSVGKDSKMDMFSRLKVLEERVLFLEGVSPEYFKTGPPPPKRKKLEHLSAPAQPNPAQVKKEYQNLSDINQRIQELQTALQQKAKHDPMH